MTAASRPAGSASVRAAVVFAAAAALATTAWLADPVADGTAATGATLADPSRERAARTDGFLSASPFDPERRAVDGIGSLSKPEPPPRVVEAAPATPEPILAGILVEGSARMAMFDGAWHDVGSPVSGWIISAIEPERVTLRQGRQSLVLRRQDAFRP